jgi:hypothetical protein
MATSKNWNNTRHKRGCVTWCFSDNGRRCKESLNFRWLLPIWIWRLLHLPTHFKNAEQKQCKQCMRNSGELINKKKK